MRGSNIGRIMAVMALALILVLGTSTTALAKKGGDSGNGWHDAQGYEGPGAPWSEAHP